VNENADYARRGAGAAALRFRHGRVDFAKALGGGWDRATYSVAY